jgi:hypothetical protein
MAQTHGVMMHAEKPCAVIRLLLHPSWLLNSLSPERNNLRNLDGQRDEKDENKSMGSNNDHAGYRKRQPSVGGSIVAGWCIARWGRNTRAATGIRWANQTTGALVLCVPVITLQVGVCGKREGGESR